RRQAAAEVNAEIFRSLGAVDDRRSARAVRPDKAAGGLFVEKRTGCPEGAKQLFVTVDRKVAAGEGSRRRPGSAGGEVRRQEVEPPLGEAPVGGDLAAEDIE